MHCPVITLVLFFFLHPISTLNVSFPEDEHPFTISNNSDKELSNRTNAAMGVILNINNQMTTLNRILESFTSSIIFDREKKLQAQLDIIAVLRNSYGVYLKDPNWRKCTLGYVEQKNILQMEISALARLCGFGGRLTTNNTNNTNYLLNLEKFFFDKRNKISRHAPRLFHTCGQEAPHLFVAISQLLTDQYNESFGCAIETTTRTIVELAKTKYFDHVERKSRLLSKELRFLLAKYDRFQKKPSANNTMDMEKKPVIYRKELAKIRRERNAMLLHAEIRKFRKAVFDFRFRLNRSDFETSINQVANYVERDIFKRFLDFREKSFSNDSISAIGREIRAYNRLGEMIFDITEELPKEYHHVRMNPAALFTGKSSTLGKQCENSPNHLIGTCNRRNNEICSYAPEATSKELQMNIDSLMKSKIVVANFLLTVKHCICGFHPRCVPNSRAFYQMSKSSSCILIPDEKGKCRGGLGYPCKTHPLAKRTFGQTCVSGKCNEITNECY